MYSLILNPVCVCVLKSNGKFQKAVKTNAKCNSLNISIIILVQNRRDFNERTVYKYMSEVKGTNTGWCCTEGLAKVRSHYCPMKRGGQKLLPEPEASHGHRCRGAPPDAGCSLI